MEGLNHGVLVLEGVTVVGMCHRCLVTKGSAMACVPNSLPRFVNLHLSMAQTVPMVAVAGAVSKAVMVTDNITVTVTPTVHDSVLVVAQTVSDTISNAMAKVVTKMTMAMVKTNMSETKAKSITITKSMPVPISVA